MSNFKQGKFNITNQALEIWNLPKDAEVLDVGCAQGETVEYLEKEYGYKACGIDISKDIIEQGLKRNPNLNIKYGDGEFMDEFLSYSFDGVMMKCVLSLIGFPDEALHEAYCVLKKGGKLLINDIYIKDPDPELLKAVELEVEKERNAPHDHDHNNNHDHEDECGSEHSEDGEEHDHDHENVHIEEPRYRASIFRSNGRFLVTPLLEQLKEIGYTNISWKDCTTELENEYSFEDNLKPHDKYETGYFMLTAEKPL